jgi:hypothetical protein
VKGAENGLKLDRAFWRLVQAFFTLKLSETAPFETRSKFFAYPETVVATV